MSFNMMLMSDGTDYRVLVEFHELREIIDKALKEGGLLALPMRINLPGSPVTINPQQIINIREGRY